MSDVHPTEAEGRTPTPDDQLDELREYAIDHMRGYGMESRLAIGFLTFDALLAARSPAPSDGYLSPELEREYQSIVASHYEDIPPAAPSVEARDGATRARTRKTQEPSMTDDKDTPSWPKGADDFLDRFDPPPGSPDIKHAMMEELRRQAIEIDRLTDAIAAFTTADVEAVIAARNVYRARHHSGHAALDALAGRLAAIVTPVAVVTATIRTPEELKAYFARLIHEHKSALDYLADK